MAAPEQERMDAISAALARVVRTQEQFAERLARIEAVMALPAQSAVIDAPPPIPRPAVPVPPPPLPQPPPAPQDTPLPQPVAVDTRGFETSVGLTLVNRVGAVTLVLGIGFFFKWAVDNNWIGPAGRVELGVLAGLLIIGGADVLWRRGQKTFAQGVTAVGISILYLALFAAFAFYHLVPQSLSFIAMAVTTAMAGALALRYDAVAISALGLVGGFLTPMLLSTGEDHPWFLFPYLLLLDVAALALAKAKKWHVLELVSFAGTELIFLGWFGSRPTRNPAAATLFGLIFFALFAIQTSFQAIALISLALTALVVSLTWPQDPVKYFPLGLMVAAGGMALADLRRWRYALSVGFASFWIWSGFYCADLHGIRPVESLFLGLTGGFLLFLCWIPWWFLVRHEKARTQDLTILALNGAAYFGGSYYLLNPQYHAWMGFLAVALAGVHLGLGYKLWESQTEEERVESPVLLAVGVALTFVTLAAPIQFTAWRITMAWALEAAALSWIGARVRNTWMTGGSAVVFIFVCVRLAIIDAFIYSAPAQYTAIFNQRFLTFGVAAVCLWLAARWIPGPKELRLTYYLAGHLVLLWTLTQEVLGWAGRSGAENTLSLETISITILYAVYAVALVSLGVATRTAVNRIAGLGLIGFVVLKLYLFDVWQLGRVYRTLAFVALGILMLSTSFLYSRFRSLIESWWKDDEVQP